MYTSRDKQRKLNEMTWTWQSKGNLKRKTEPESLLIDAQNNAMRTIHVKSKLIIHR